MSEAETESSAPAIQAARLCRWYGRVTALQGVTLQLGAGIWGLLGPNGSGKTTLMRLVAGQLRPSLGQLRVCGASPHNNPKVLSRIGLCPEADALYDTLSALEFVTAMAELSGIPRRSARDRAVAALDEFGLGRAMERRMGTYSRGMRQRAKLAQAVVHEPDVLLLDEPLTGTDPTSRRTILEAVRRRAERGALVLYSTHVLPEVEALTDQLILIARGQVVAQGAMQEIRDLLDEHPHQIQVVCDRPRALAAQTLTASAGVVAVHLMRPDTLEVRTSNPDETYRVLAETALAGDFDIRSLKSPDAELETLFHYLVERAQRGAGTGADAGQGNFGGIAHHRAASAKAGPS